MAAAIGVISVETVVWDRNDQDAVTVNVDAVRSRPGPWEVHRLQALHFVATRAECDLAPTRRGLAHMKKAKTWSRISLSGKGDRCGGTRADISGRKTLRRDLMAHRADRGNPGCEPRVAPNWLSLI